MPLLSIIYYGKPGLEAEIFHSYMTSYGYRVQTVMTEADAFNAVHADASAVVVLSLDQKPDESIRLVQTLRDHTDGAQPHTFILTDEKTFDPGLPRVYVIPRPLRLGALVARIQALSRQP